MSALTIGGSKRGRQGRAPPGPNSFIFMQFSSKNLQNNPNLAVGAPPRENPGSATVDGWGGGAGEGHAPPLDRISFIFIEFYCENFKSLRSNLIKEKLKTLLCTEWVTGVFVQFFFSRVQIKSWIFTMMKILIWNITNTSLKPNWTK